MSDADSLQFYWEGDGQHIESYFYWHNDSIPTDFNKDFILYNFNGTKPRVSPASVVEPHFVRFSDCTKYAMFLRCSDLAVVSWATCLGAGRT